MHETLSFCKKKKKRRMRILGACIFSKFFGGKITPFETDVTYRVSMNQKKKNRIFSEFFGEKTKRFQTAVTEKNHEL